MIHCHLEVERKAMNFYEVLYKIAHEKGISTRALAKAIGRSSAYITIQKSRGSLPIVSTASMLVSALDYKLCIVPADSVPEDAYIIE